MIMRNFKCPKKLNGQSVSDDELGIHRHNEERREENEEPDEELDEELDEEPDEEPDEDDDDEEQEDDDENLDVDTSSSETWTRRVNTSINRYRRILSTSEESNESGSGAYLTPPSTVAVDSEPMEFSTTVGHIRTERSRNVARRQRARRPGGTSYRRGRSRQPTSEQEFIPLTPFAQGITFNGFARKYDPIEIVGYTFDSSDRVMYKVNWRQDAQPWRPIESSLMRTYKPSMVIDYYEAELRRTHQNRFLYH